MTRPPSHSKPERPQLERPATPSKTDIVAPTAVATAGPVPPAPRGPSQPDLPKIIVVAEPEPPLVVAPEAPAPITERPKPPAYAKPWDTGEATMAAEVPPPGGHGVAIAVGATTAIVVAIGGVALFQYLHRPSPDQPEAAATATATSVASAAPPAPPPSAAPAVPAPPPPGPALGPKDAAITIVCEPVACEKVAIDGKVRKAPAEPLVLPEGKHGIGVSRSGYAGAWKLVPLAAGQRTTVQFTLTPMPGKAQRAP